MNDRIFTSNILIVDDEPSNLLALEAILEPLGQNLIRAASGVEALKHALKHEVSVVLMDVQMPEMDGFEAAELLRKRPKTRDVPIIFLTAISKDRKFISRGYDVGAVDYLFKPYEPDILRSKVSVFVELAKKNAIIREQAEELRRMSERELAEFKKRSEQRYENLADSMPQIVWTANALGTVQYGNRRWNELANNAREFSAVVHPDDLSAFMEGWRTAVAKGSEWEAELRFGNAERGYCFHLVRAVPRIEEGRIEGWIGTSTEIDARVRAERALRLLADASRRLGASLDEPSELEAVLRSSLTLLGDAAVLDLRDGTANGARDGEKSRRVITAHPVDAAVVEDPRFELGPATVAYSHRPEVYLDVEAEMEATHSGRGAENIRFLSELRVSGYMCLPLHSHQRTIGTLTFVKLAGGRYEPADVPIAEDLASRIAVAIDNVRLHETTEKRREELEQANKSKDVFLATLSHELRTPLNAIVGWTDMMKNGALQGDELQRAFDTIDRNAHALNGLVADLLDVSRIVTDTLKLDAKLVSIGAVAEAAIEAARPQAAMKQVNLELTVERGGSVRGDSGRLRQIIANLLSNAIKFTPAGGTVALRIERDGENRARVSVKDSGEGITADFLPHVFERFRQAETARAKGLGLGLAIVKHLAEAHGGTVRAESGGRGQGATFVVDLPIETEEVASSEEEARVSHPPSGQPRLENLHILVVEDDPDGNELITTILERYGARVTSVGTATAALDALEKEIPNVLISDIGLPDKDGIELIKTVRAKEGLGPLPAIALTAYASRQDAAKALAAGFDAHVAKPVQPGTLGAAVARLIARDSKSVSAA